MNLLTRLEDWPYIILPITIILSFLLLGWLVEQRVVSQLLSIAREKNLRFSEGVLRSLRGLSILWFGLLGLNIALSLPNLPLFPSLILLSQKLLLVAFLASATWVVAQLSVEILRVYTTGDDGISSLTSLFEFLAKVLIFSCGFLLILSSIGISITPMLTAFGIGGVSLGLALQNTLANLMSGINIITSKKVRPGDYIELRTGEAGYVRDVDLRCTVIEEITNNLLVIPNAQIISSSFRNYSLPDHSLLIPVEVGISYDSDLEKVEKVTLEVMQEIAQLLQPHLGNYKPLILYGKLDYYSIVLTVYLKVVEEEFFQHLTIKHEFIKLLHRRYQQEGIKLPYPILFPYPLAPPLPVIIALASAALLLMRSVLYAARSGDNPLMCVLVTSLKSGFHVLNCITCSFGKSIPIPTINL